MQNSCVQITDSVLASLNKEPVPAHSWGETILDATIEGPACTQFDTTSNLAKGVEDCLALNVYSPQVNKHQAVINRLSQYYR